MNILHLRSDRHGNKTPREEQRKKSRDENWLNCRFRSGFNGIERFKMLAQYKRRYRDYTGPTPNSVAIVSKDSC